MTARLWLHAALAVIAPAPLFVLMLVFSSPLRGEAGELLLFGAAVVAGQLAALFGWRSIRSSGQVAAFFHGIVMGLVMHVVFGPALLLVGLVIGQSFRGISLLYLMFLATWHSLKLAMITLPLCAAAAVLVQRTHQRELDDERTATRRPRRW